jgi:hypothetical protein
MSPRIITPSPRQALTWGLVLVVLVTASVAAALALGRVGKALSFGSASPPLITHETVVERIRDVAKLVSVEMTMRDVVTYEQTQFRSTKRALLVVTARVSAGIDLSRNTAVQIDSATKRITISLPPSQVMSVDVIDVKTYDESAGLWNPFRPSDRDAMQRRVRTQMMQDATESGILRRADDNAAKILTDLLTRDGYTVQIRRPPVQGAPLS